MKHSVKALFILVPFLFFCCSASREPDTKRVLEGFSEIKKLSSERLFVGDSLKLPKDIRLKDSVFVVSEEAGSRPLVLIGKNGIIIKSFGKNGNGPNELVSPWTLQTDASSRFVRVYDINLKKILSFELDSVLKKPGHVGIETLLRDAASVSCTAPLWIDDSLFVSPGLFTDKSHVLINLAGQIKRSYSFYEAPKGVPMEVYNHVCYSQMSISPNKKTIAACFQFGDRIDLYKLTQGKDLTKYLSVVGPEVFGPEYEIGQMGERQVMIHKNARCAYMDVQATDKFVYALFSGRYRKETINARYSYYLNVFSWDGEPIRQYELDRSVYSIAVDEANGFIYGLHGEEFTDILRFKM
jgi:hypothetical protein